MGDTKKAIFEGLDFFTELMRRIQLAFGALTNAGVSDHEMHQRLLDHVDPSQPNDSTLDKSR